MGSGLAVTSSISVTNHGWGAGIRTPEMSESESDALPLGDTPIFSTDIIIADNFAVVNTYFKLFSKKYSFFSKISLFLLYKYFNLCYNTKAQINLPVAQLDSASDSDSEGQRFESVRVGQKSTSFI